MKVNVEIVTGTYLDPEVSDTATVKELKEKIGTELKLPVKRLLLVVEDEEFEEDNRLVMENEDEMMLRDLGVRQDSRIYLIIKELDDSVSSVERSQGGEDDEVSSEPMCKGGNQEEEKARIEDDKSLKKEVEDRNEKVEDEKEEKEKRNDEGEEGNKKEET